MPTPLRMRDTRIPVPAGPLALGMYCLLLGVVFYVPFMLSSLAQQNDVFMTNLFLGLGALVLGGALVAVAAAQLAAQTQWLRVTLSVLSALLAFVGIAAIFTTNSYASAAPIMAAYTALLLALSAIPAAGQGHFIAWARALLLALSAAGVVTLYYALFGGQYHDVNGVATYLPRYLDGQTSGLALLLGIAVFVLGRVWAARA